MVLVAEALGRCLRATLAPVKIRPNLSYGHLEPQGDIAPLNGPGRWRNPSELTGWRLVEWGPDQVLLIGRDGGWFGGAGAEVCYEALLWSNGTILTVGPAPEIR